MELLDAFNALTMMVYSTAIRILSVEHRGFNFTLVFPFSTKVFMGLMLLHTAYHTECFYLAFAMGH